MGRRHALHIAGGSSRLLVTPKSITIRDVPEDTTAEPAAQCRSDGRSMQEYVEARLVELAGTPDPYVWVARVRERKSATGGSISVQRVLDHPNVERR